MPPPVMFSWRLRVLPQACALYEYTLTCVLSPRLVSAENQVDAHFTSFKGSLLFLYCPTKLIYCQIICSANVFYHIGEWRKLIWYVYEIHRSNFEQAKQWVSVVYSAFDAPSSSLCRFNSQLLSIACVFLQATVAAP